MDVRSEAEGKVARLLAMVCNDATDPEAYDIALKALTRLAILGTAPASSRSTYDKSRRDNHDL